MNESLLKQLKTGIQVLFDVAGNQLQHGINENGIQFSLQFQLELISLSQTLNQLAPFVDLFNINLMFTIQAGQGSADLRNTGLVTVDWEEDDLLSPPDLINVAAIELYSELAQQLGQRDTEIQPDNFVQNLDQLKQAGAEITLSLYAAFDKNELIRSLEWPQYISNVIYISADKFLQRLTSEDYWNVEDFLIPDTKDILIVLLGTAHGIAIGPNVRICGLDHWDSQDSFDFVADKPENQKISAVLNFREEESNWEMETSALTPHHLYIERQEFDRPDVLESIARLRDRFAVAYLADRVKSSDGRLECQFKGHKQVWIFLPPLSDGNAAESIFKLFAWGFDNSSSDKLSIVRQIISLQLGHDTDDNYAILRERAADMLGAAKSNFRIFLRRSVELYFDKRLKVSEFIQKFSEEMGSSVSALTSELISNLYKTVGIILGVVIAALVNPKQTPQVIYWTSLLYLIYIGFILFYLLPATYLRFNNKTQEYRHSIAELHDVLSSEEILRLQGNSFQRARWLFLVYFAVTNLLYALLGLTSFMLTRFFLGLL